MAVKAKPGRIHMIGLERGSVVCLININPPNGYDKDPRTALDVALDLTSQATDRLANMTNMHMYTCTHAIMQS
jgi:hypothetical protein